MKSYESFDDWVADQNARNRKLITLLRKLVRKASPRLSESVKWGNGCWIGKEYPVIFLHAKDDHLQLGFFAGASLSDPKKLLTGKGEYVRHTKVRVAKDIDEAAFTRLIRLAAKLERS